ncbi:hypothetical protein BJ742DRAFT_850699 [Cladochytrium replicatum]|nr:hypothetical protein BJ742DRAFT_850699 [Cladochytrium replicatum]
MASIAEPSRRTTAGGANRTQRPLTRACDRCYSRKVRCFSTPEFPNAPCKNCESSGLSCTYGDPQYRTRPKRTSKGKDEEAQKEKQTADDPPTRSNVDVEVDSSPAVGLALGSELLEVSSTAFSPEWIALHSSADPLTVPDGESNAFPSETTQMCCLSSHEVQSLSGEACSAEVFGPAPPNPIHPNPANISIFEMLSRLMGASNSFKGGTETCFTPRATWGDQFGGHLSVPFETGVLDGLLPFVLHQPSQINQPMQHVVESPTKLLSTRQKDELIDAYFNFINPCLPFLHPGHFWKEYKAGRVPEYLLDTMFALSMRYMNPAVNIPDSLGISLYALSLREVQREGSESLSSASTPPLTDDERSSSPRPPNDPHRSWIDVGQEEYVRLNRCFYSHAMEGVAKLNWRAPSLSSIHAMLLSVVMKMGLALCPISAMTVLQYLVKLAVQMGLNVDQPGKPFEKSIRRRTWWCIVIVEAIAGLMKDEDTCLPDSYTPPFPEMDPGDGSATGAWSPESTRAFIALADICRITIQKIRQSHTDTVPITADMDEHMNSLCDWEFRHRASLKPPRRADSDLLHEKDIYPWVLTSSAKLMKNALIIACLRPAALAFHIGASAEQDWSPYIRYNMGKGYSPSYSTWITAQNALHADTLLFDKTPNQVLSRVPLLHVVSFNSVAMCFQTLLHQGAMTDRGLCGEAARMLDRLCKSMKAANPWGNGMMYDNLLEFCLKFADEYISAGLHRVSIFSRIAIGDGEKPSCSSWPLVEQPTLVRENVVAEIDSQVPHASEPKFTCEGLFLDYVQSSDEKFISGDPITPQDYTEVQLKLMGSSMELKWWMFKHLDFPASVRYS